MISKRLRDCTLWTQAWYVTLPPAFREIWNYLNDTCDESGIWRSDFRSLALIFGCGISEKQFRQFFGDRVLKISDDQFFIPSFLEVQACEVVNG